jgi:hypothetical protein
MTPSIQQQYPVKILNIIDIISDVLVVAILDKGLISLWKNLYYQSCRKLRPLIVVPKNKKISINDHNIRDESLTMLSASRFLYFLCSDS